MTAHTTPPSSGAAPRELRSPADLREVMQSDYTVSAQQWEAISAPLEPAVVIAGAGSGKTSVMAARVVYLVVTGQVRPDQVLGLTFTTKAASELRTRIREALDVAGFARGVVTDDGGEEVLEPVVATYNAYASALLAEHGLRIGHEPDTRVIADAARYQLAGRVIDRHHGPVVLLSDSPQHVIDYILALDGALAEHLVRPGELRAFDQQEAPRFAAELTGKTAARRRSRWWRTTGHSSERSGSWTSPTRSRWRPSWPTITPTSALSSAPNTASSCSTNIRTPRWLRR